MGLTVARAIVQAHGGLITAANLAAGGAIFSVQLPAAPQAAQGAPAGQETIA